MSLPVLIVSGDPAHQAALSSTAANCGLASVLCVTIEAAKYLLARREFSAVLYEMLEKEDFRTSIRQLARSASEAPVIVVSTLDNWDSYLAVISAGATDYVDFPLYQGELERLLYAALMEPNHIAKYRPPAPAACFQ